MADKLTGKLSLVGALSGTLTPSITIKGSIMKNPNPYDFYDGAYTVTPTISAQTLSTKELVLTQNITINPIPSNYGLITWNGSTLTVS